MGQPADKADGVDENHLLAAGQNRPAGGGVKGGEQLILRDDLGAAQRVEQAGFADVGIADQRDDRHRVVLPAAAGLSASLLDRGELAPDQFHPPAQMPPVVLELALTGPAAGAGTPCAAAALPGEPVPQPGQPGQPVGEGGELGLKLALVGGRPGGEDFEDQQRPIDHRQPQLVLEVFDLGAGQLIVENADLDLLPFAEIPRLGEPALAEVTAGIRRIPPLGDLKDRLHPGALGQCPQLGQAALEIPVAAVRRKEGGAGRDSLFRSLHTASVFVLQDLPII